MEANVADREASELTNITVLVAAAVYNPAQQIVLYQKLVKVAGVSAHVA